MDVAGLIERFGLPPRPSRPVTLGVIGCGAIATSAHVPALNILRQAGWPVEVTAVCDIERSRAEALAAAAGCARVFTGAADALASGLFHATLILTPPAACPELCEAAIQAGHHAMVEKPVAADAVTIKRLAEAADRAAVRVQVAYNRRHQPLLAPFLHEVERASPQHVIARFWRVARSEPLFYSDTAIHMVDLLNRCFGPLLVTDVRTWPPQSPGAIPSGARVDFRSAAGPTIEMDVRPAAGLLAESVEVIGARRTVRIAYQHKPQDFDAFEVHMCDNGRRRSLFSRCCNDASDPAMVFLQGFVHQLGRFCRVAAEGERPACTLADAAAARGLCERIGL